MSESTINWTNRHLESRHRNLNSRHGWLVWPVDGFTELVFAVRNAVDRDKDEVDGFVGRDLELREV
jgi:hypothetical protein